MHATAPKERIRTPYTKEPKKRLSQILKTKKKYRKANPIPCKENQRESYNFLQSTKPFEIVVFR